MSAPSGSAVPAPPTGAAAAVPEQLVVIPRDRRCPMFNGRTGISIAEWVEEVRACMHARHLSTVDQAYFVFDHLEGDAREEIRYRTSNDRGDPVVVFAVLKELYGCA